MLSLIIKLLLVLQIIELTTTALSVKRHCQSAKCGGVDIQYPFGTRFECSMNIWFLINCSGERPILSSIGLEVIKIEYSNSRLLVKSPLISNNCSDHKSGQNVTFRGTPFTFSGFNRFVVVGCNGSALLTHAEPSIIGCQPTCSNKRVAREEEASPCVGNMCCQTSIPYFLQVFSPRFQEVGEGENSCMITFIAEETWMKDNVKDPNRVQEWEYVHVLLDWKINASDLGWLGIDGETTDVFTDYYDGIDFPYPKNTFLMCRGGFTGNPYLPEGCIDVNECLEPKVHRQCRGFCTNTRGSYKCMGGIIIIATSGGFILLILGILIWWLSKFIKKRKEINQKRKFFKQNGGLLLRHQQTGSSVEKIKIFTSRELEKATDHFNVNRILGQGGQGTVYKGMLVDGRIVAVKKSEKVSEAKIQEFSNEVFILSQINHRNVVKLLGCCLETEVPLLVYEFIPNGTLYHYLHENNEEFQLSWKMRFQIATEVSEVLFYLHSAASLPIYHRDIKSTNILLDEMYRAKVSDFGISRSIEVDQTHLTTHVLGTFGYVDPEYFQSRKFTEKSDVYSFGVVLVELLTGTKPVSSTRVQEGVGLAAHFIRSMQDEKLLDVIDPRIKDQCDMEQVMIVANLARQCLNPNGKHRPTMKELTIQLEGIRMSQKDSIVQTNNTSDIESEPSEDSYSSRISSSASPRAPDV
ncbi:hypothetical protein JCGZ_26946 [Jatropha curcas]|uniref:Protein kinase domain-containing protein n=2 Tax=Jatropha curcas TaxID=180498 RepID=A0A067L3W3_JATCU|nr:hypothetical protein JCGZ_26946 [Jatropha curcas]